MDKLYNLYQCKAFRRDEDESNLKKASSIQPKSKITYDKILDNYCTELEKEEKSVLQVLEKLNTMRCIDEKNTILEKNDDDDDDYDSDEDAEYFAKQYDVLLVDDGK